MITFENLPEDRVTLEKIAAMVHVKLCEMDLADIAHGVKPLFEVET
jgi:hypothetical protein